MERADVLIVGAGPGGLSAAAAVEAQGRRAIVLEASDGIGGLWAQVPGDLRCLSPRERDRLPDGSYPKGPGPRATAREVLDAWRRFYEGSELDVRFGARAERLERDGRGYVLHAGPRAWAAPRIVLATGEHTNPWRPALPGRFEGPLDHSATIDLDAVRAGERVCVVGSGNSAADLVPRLLARGATVTVSARTPVAPPHRAPGGPAGALLWRASGLPIRWLPRRGGCVDSTPVIDPGLFEATRSGRVRAVGEALGYASAGLQVSGGEVVPADRIVMATGFRRALGWVDGLALGPGGGPRHREGRSLELPGVWFIGLPCMRTRRSGFLRGLSGDARAIAGAL